jgi:hypothetical protein
MPALPSVRVARRGLLVVMASALVFGSVALIAGSAGAAVRGETLWEGGTGEPRGTSDPIPTVTMQAVGAIADVGYEPVSATDTACSVGVRSMGPPYVVLADGAGTIAATTVRVREGGTSRPSGTYYLCFRATNPEFSSWTAPLTLSIGGTSTTTKTATGTATTTTTTTPWASKSASPSGPVCTVAPTGDQTAIMAAIASCPDGKEGNPTIVRFPPGATYKASGPIRIDDRHNLIIDGNGSTFHKTTRSNAPGSGNFVMLRGENITFEDMVVRGSFDLRPAECPPTWSNACRVYDLNRFPTDWSWETNGAWMFYGTNGGGVRDAQAFDVWGDGVTAAMDGMLDATVDQWSWQVGRNLVVERILVDNASRVCLAPVNSINNTFRDSTFRNCWTWGVDAEAAEDADGNLHNRLPIDGLRLLNNTFEGYNYGAIAVPVGGDADTIVGNIEIRGNRMLTGPQQAPCQASILIGVEQYSNRIRNAVVEENTIGGLSRYVAFHHVDGGAIRNNTFVHRSYGLEPYDDPRIQCSPSPGTAVAPVVVNDSTTIGVSGNTGPDRSTTSSTTTRPSTTTTTVLTSSTTTTVAPTTTTPPPSATTATVASTTTTTRPPCLLLILC